MGKKKYSWIIPGDGNPVPVKRYKNGGLIGEMACTCGLEQALSKTKTEER